MIEHEWKILYTVAEAARKIERTTQNLYSAIKRGKLQAVEAPKMISYIEESELERWGERII